MSGIGADLLEDCSMHVDRRRRKHGRRRLSKPAPELQPWMQNVVDDVSLRVTAAGLTRTDTVVLLRLDSCALERKVYTGCVQARASSAGSRALWCHMAELARISCESCCSVQHGLNPIKVTLRQSSQGNVTVVDL